MKTKLFLTMLVAFGALSSCSKDEDPAPLTKEQATVEIADLKATYDSESTAMENSEGMKVSETLNSLDLPFVLPIEEESGRRGMDSFYNIMEQAKQGNITSLKRDVAQRSSGFVFDEFVGTWDWNSDTQQFVKSSSSPTNQIVLKFPYPISNTTNNATYTISKFTLGASATGEYAANITIDGSEVWSISYFVSVNKSAITYSGKETYTSLTTPKVVYEYNSSMSVSGSESGDVSESVVKVTQSLKKNGETKLSGAYSLSTKTSGTAFSVAAKASLIVAKIKFVCEVSYNGDANGGSGTMTQNVKMGVYTLDGAKVGDIKYETVDGVVVAMFYYVNGEKVPAAELFGEVFGKWDGMFGEIVDF